MTKHKLTVVTCVGCLLLAVCAIALYGSQRRECAIASCNAPFPQAVSGEPPQPQTSTENLRLQAQAITVRVMSQEFLGSGILWQQQDSIYTVVTNAHVLRAGDAPYRIQTPDGEIYSANVPKNSKFGTNDLAILRFYSPKKIYPVSSIGSQPMVGDEVFASGFYSEEDEEKETFSFTTGKVSLLLPQALEGGYQIGYNNKIQKGMSGGPLLNRRGELIGVNGMQANPLWDVPSVFVDGSEADKTLHEQINSLSWAVPIETLEKLVLDNS
ncbi:trypsin-like peptidase domain-containing protein [Tolypothrix sp. FACHB-123]|uniref:S1 family peptidase n=1 Tax=Tolypothrix sp. FACHB-123 TaxID=2692868 RepID=UPI001688AA27|nr:serine protease [Tolypothrix sp. FACHB-123]MBD2353540.1 trypsin-like peptidase domain-containing protein [Tolypothrix sp. FACHB-123]